MINKKKRLTLLFLSVLFGFAILFSGICFKTNTVKADEQVYPTEINRVEFYFSRLSGFYNDFKNNITNKNMSVSETLYGVDLSVEKSTGTYYPSWTKGSSNYFTVRMGNQVKIKATNGDRVYGVCLYGRSSLNAASNETLPQGQPKINVTANTGEVVNNGLYLGWTGNASEVVLTFNLASGNTNAYTSYEFERLVMWSSSENITAPSNPTFTADVSALAEDLNTANAKTVYFGQSTTVNNAEVAPLTWKVVGYNGEGVASKPGTMTLMADEVLYSGPYRDKNYDYGATTTGREYHPYGVSNANKVLTEIAGGFSTIERNAIYERALFDSVQAAYGAPMWMPSQAEIFEVHQSIKGTNSYSTRTFTSNSNFKGSLVTYSSSGWNLNSIYYGNDHRIRPMLMVDLSQVESVSEGANGIFRFNFIRPPHTHEWEYVVSSDGEKLIATCGASDCFATSQDLSINIADKDYDRSTTLAVINTNNWQADSLLDVVGLNIKYVGVGETDYAETATAPEDAGTYKAKLTVDSYTIEKLYTIRPIDVDFPADMSPSSSQHELFKTLNAASYEIQLWMGKTNSAFDGEMVYNGNSYQVVHTQTSKNDIDYGYSYYNVKGGYAVFSVDGMNGPWTMTPCIKDAGTHKVYWKIQAANGNFIGTEADSNNFIYAVIEKADSEIITSPTAKTNLIYNGNFVELINEGSVNGGHLVYKLGANGSYSADIPQAKNAGSYEIYYKIQGNGNFNGTDEDANNKLTVTIQKANRTSTPTLTENTVGDVFVAFDQIEIIDGVVEYGYSLTENGEYVYSTDSEITNLSDGTTYYFRYRIINSNNYNDFVSEAISLTTDITDVVKPQILGVTENTRYCVSQTLTIVEENLLFVKVDGVDVTGDLVDGKLVLGLKEQAQTILVKDVAGNESTLVVKIFGHEAGSWIVDTIPKIEQNGSKHTECIHCGETLETLSIPALIADAEQDESVEKTESVIDETAPQTQIKNNLSEIRQNVLTIEDEEAIANGKKVNIYIEVKDITTSVSEETVGKVTEKVGEDVAVVYLDLSLFKQIGENDATSVHQLNGKIKISIVVPDSIKQDGRVYQVVRVHDGVAEIINGEYDHETGEFTFETDKFSTYALTYVEETLPTNRSNIALFVAGGAVVAVICVVIVVIMKKRKKA